MDLMNGNADPILTIFLCFFCAVGLAVWISRKADQ
jgi:hypothetical protein